MSPEEGYNMSEDKKEDLPISDEQKVKFVNKLFEQSKKYKDNYKKHITTENLKLYKGEQYNPDMQLESKEYIVSNRIFSTIENVLPILTDNRPQFNYMSSSPDKQNVTEVLNKIVTQYWWSQADMDLKIPENMKNVLIYGTGFMLPYWDNEAANGLGDVRVKVYSPFGIFPCPAYGDLDSKIPYFVLADYVPIEEVKKYYPLAVNITSDGARDPAIPDVGEDTNIASDGVAQVTDTDGSSTEYVPLTNSYGGREEKQVLLKQVILKDPDTVTYPYGKIITIANNTFLGEEPNTSDYYPNIVKFIDMVMPGEFWGMGEVVQIKDPQRMINKFKSMVVNILRFVSDPPLITDQGAIDDDDLENWINEPGIVIEKTPGSEVAWLQMQMPNPGLIGYVQEAEREINTISGIQEWTPSKGGGLPSGNALYQMQEIGQTRLRLKMRNMEASLKKLGIMVVKLMLKNYTEPRIMRIMGDDSKAQYVKIYREPDPAIAQEMKLQIEGTPEEPSGMISINLAEIDPDIDLEVTIEPALPLGKSAQFQQGQTLLQMGAIDPQAMLEISDFPDKEKIAERMKATGQASQQAEQQKEMLEAKVKTAPKLSLSLNGEDLTPDEKGQILAKNGIKPNEARQVEGGQNGEESQEDNQGIQG